MNDYQAPAKAGVASLEMEQIVLLAQAARKHPIDLVSAFQQRPLLEQDRLASG